MRRIDSFVPATQAKWQEMFKQVLENGEAIAITENGVPGAVLLPYDDFTGLLETIDVLADNETVRQMLKSAKDAEQGRFIDMDEAFK